MEIVNRIKKLDFTYLIVVFLLIYMGSNTLFTQIYISTQVSAYLVFGVALGIYAIKGNFRLRLKRNSVIIILLLISSIFITLLVNWDISNFNGYILMLCFYWQLHH